MSKKFDKTKPPEVFYDDPPSKEFEDAVDSFFCHGSCRGYCEICGVKTVE